MCNIIYIANINNIIQRAKGEIDNTLLKDEDFHKYLLNHTKCYFILKRNKSYNFHTLCCKKKFFLSCSKTHFENRRSCNIQISHNRALLENTLFWHFVNVVYKYYY